MRIAFVHDWLASIGGDVRVLKALHDMYPGAPIFCLNHDKAFTGVFFDNANIIPCARYFSKVLLPFYPSMIESLDLSDFDLVISTGSIFSKGLVLRPKTYHINYCHSPTRQVWDLSAKYRRKIFQHFLRVWDRQASARVDMFIANSEHVKDRIKKYYRRNAEVVYPPVTVSPPTSPYSKGGSEGGYLIVSRLHKHKNIDIAVRAFNKLGWALTVIGDGPEYARLKALAGPTVRIMGKLPDSLLATHYSLCTAFVMPQDEDFGIAPIEAMMFGKPVLALKAGGALEYVEEGINGLFFDDAHEAVLADGVRRIKEMKFDTGAVIASAQQFTCQKFQSSFYNIINRLAR